MFVQGAPNPRLLLGDRLPASLAFAEFMRRRLVACRTFSSFSSPDSAAGSIEALAALMAARNASILELVAMIAARPVSHPASAASASFPVTASVRLACFPANSASSRAAASSICVMIAPISSIAGGSSFPASCQYRKCPAFWSPIRVTRPPKISALVSPERITGPLDRRAERLVRLAEEIFIGVNKCAVSKALAAEWAVIIPLEGHTGFKPALMCHTAFFRFAFMRDNMRPHSRKCRLRDPLDGLAQQLPQRRGLSRQWEYRWFGGSLQLVGTAHTLHLIVLGGNRLVDVRVNFKRKEGVGLHCREPNGADDRLEFGFRSRDGLVVIAVLAVKLDDAADQPHALFAHDKAVLVLQMIGGNDVAREHVVINESAIVDGNARARPAPNTALENGVLSGKEQYGFRRRIRCKRLRPARIAGLFTVSERKTSARVDLPQPFSPNTSVQGPKVAPCVGFAISNRPTLWMNLTSFSMVDGTGLPRGYSA